MSEYKDALSTLLAYRDFRQSWDLQKQVKAHTTTPEEIANLRKQRESFPPQVQKQAIVGTYGYLHEKYGGVSRFLRRQLSPPIAKEVILVIIFAARSSRSI